MNRKRSTIGQIKPYWIVQRDLTVVLLHFTVFIYRFKYFITRILQNITLESVAQFIKIIY